MAETLQNLLLGFQVVLAPSVLVYAFLGCVIGTMVGVLPGLGPSPASASSCRSASVSPTTAIVLLAGIYYGAMYGGSTTSILMRVPGEAASVYHLHRRLRDGAQGRAGPALAIAASAPSSPARSASSALMLLAPPLAASPSASGRRNTWRSW